MRGLGVADDGKMIKRRETRPRVKMSAKSHAHYHLSHLLQSTSTNSAKKISSEQSGNDFY